MLLEDIFNGGSQPGSSSQTSSSSGSSEAAQEDAITGDDAAAAPADGSQSDSVENYSPEETDDGTYSPTQPLEASTDEPAEYPVEGEASVENETDAAPAYSVSQPVEETEAPQAAPDADDEALADEIAAEQPASSGPASTTEQEDGTGAEAVAEAADNKADGSGSATPSNASTGVRDFLTSFMSDLEAINSRPVSSPEDEVSASQKRAAANVQSEMIRRMLDQISTDATGSTATQLFKSDDDGEAQSLPARWYAEA